MNEEEQVYLFKRISDNYHQEPNKNKACQCLYLHKNKCYFTGTESGQYASNMRE